MGQQQPRPKPPAQPFPSNCPNCHRAFLAVARIHCVEPGAALSCPWRVCIACSVVVQRGGRYITPDNTPPRPPSV